MKKFIEISRQVRVQHDTDVSKFNNRLVVISFLRREARIKSMEKLLCPSSFTPYNA